MGPDQGGEWRMDNMVLVKILPRYMFGMCFIYNTRTRIRTHRQMHNTQTCYMCALLNGKWTSSLQ